jgi:hypothetical protein
MLTLGSYVWAPFGDHGRQPRTIIGLGKNRGDYHRASQLRNPGQGQRYAGEFFWRKPELKGKDKPKATTVNA